MLPVLTHTWTEASAAERSGLRIKVRPFGRTVRSTGSRQKRSSRRMSPAAAEEFLDMKEGAGRRRGTRPANATRNARRRSSRAERGRGAARTFGGLEWFYKRVLEIVGVGEILAPVLLGLR